jgi:hypothetical protein
MPSRQGKDHARLVEQQFQIKHDEAVAARDWPTVLALYQALGGYYYVSDDGTIPNREVILTAVVLPHSPLVILEGA